MVKRKKNWKNQKTYDSNEDIVDPKSRSFIYDENDDFNELGGSDSDPDIEDDDPFITNEDEDEDEEAVLGLSTSDDSDEDIGPMDVDDIHSDEAESGGEDERGLGRRKKDFFGTDLTDQRIHKASKLKHKAREEDALLLEEESVKRLQERMAKQSIGLSQSDLIPDLSSGDVMVPSSINSIDDKSPKGKLSLDIDSMAEHVKEISVELKDILSPLVEALKTGNFSDLSSSAEEYLLTRYFLSLNYLSVVSAFMMLFSSDASNVDDSHPCVLRYEQFRQLFKELEPCKQKFESELESVLTNLKSCKNSQSSGRKILNIVKERSKKIQPKVIKATTSEGEKFDKGETSRNVETGQEFSSDEDEGSEEELEQEHSEDGGRDDELSLNTTEERRLISYKISKNKGILPYRSKDQRNPRVKYKNKYKNKLKRRKGQVREVRKELTKYMGEVSGINRNAVKSIKLK